MTRNRTMVLAIAFALAGRGVDILIVFSALGLGLASPYLRVAAMPGMIAVLPKPGRWMIGLKLFLGFLLLGTAIWLLWVLNGVAGPLATAVVGVLSVLLNVILTRPVLPPIRRRAAGIVLAVLPVISAWLLAQDAPTSADTPSDRIPWVAFDRGEIARRVSRGEVTFLDITADWCLTCKANKALVLEREPVLSVLIGGEVTAMQADWTRPDERISRFLESHNRYGIPFNAVYGPGAPDGIVLSEILSSQDVLAAFENARANTIRLGTLPRKN